MKGFFAKLKDFSPKLKNSEILLFLKSQNRWKKAYPSIFCFASETPSKPGWSNALVATVCVEAAVSSEDRLKASGGAAQTHPGLAIIPVKEPNLLTTQKDDDTITHHWNVSRK